MKCAKAHQLLSAYYDNQLASDVQAQMAAHVRGCADCAGELEFFRRLSAMAQGLRCPQPPPQLWSRIEAQLDGATMPTARLRRSAGLLPMKLIALAAMLLIAAGIGWFAYRTWHGPTRDHHLAVDFGRYLTEFQDNPEAAQRLLLARYEGRAVELGEVVRHVGYRPAVADGLPEGYSVDAVYVLKMPCCTCVQCLCRRADGQLVSIFEHDEAQPVHFRDRPAVTARCSGKQCRLVQGDGRLAASWKLGPRQITLVGARDLQEAKKLIELLGDSNRAKRRDSF